METIYIPYYERNEWHILAADAARARKISLFWMHCGTIYGPTAYTTVVGAQLYIDRHDNEAKKYLYEVA